MPVHVDYARYPFLVDIRSYLGKNYPGLRFEDVLVSEGNRVLGRAFERIEQAVERGEVMPPPPSISSGDEIIAYYASIIIVSLSGSRWLASRYALAEAEKSYKYMVEESYEAMEAIAGLLGVDARVEKSGPRIAVYRLRGTTVYKQYVFSMNFADYLRLASRLVGDPSWKLVNQALLGGRVYLAEKHRIARLLKEAVQARVLSQIRPVEEPPPQLAPLVERVQVLLAKHGRGPGSRGHELRGIVDPEAFPPCMSEIYLKALRGEHLSHHARFAIATFLLNIGADVDSVVDLFRNMPDFNERIARYQVEHLAGLRGSGKKYRVYSCSTMKSLGLCIADCGTRTPLSAYYRRLREKRSSKDRESQNTGHSHTDTASNARD